jgi:hypothetical protein
MKSQPWPKRVEPLSVAVCHFLAETEGILLFLATFLTINLLSSIINPPWGRSLLKP